MSPLVVALLPHIIFACAVAIGWLVFCAVIWADRPVKRRIRKPVRRFAKHQ